MNDFLCWAKNLVEVVDKLCLKQNRNRSQMLECVATQYLVEQKLL